MRRLLLLAVCVWAWPSGLGVGAEVTAGVSIRGGEVESFHLAVREHYHVSESDMVAVKKAKVKDEEIPIVFHVAQQAKCSPSAVVELRAGAKSWMEISAHLGLGVEVFHVEVEDDCGPPYGRALGHFKHRKRHQWGSIQLSDEDVGLLVNLSFLSARHGCSPSDVIKLHVGGESIVAFHGRVKTQKGKGKGGEAGNDPESQGKTTSASETRGPKGGSGASKSVDFQAPSGSRKGAGASASTGNGGGKGGSRGRKK